MSRGAAALPFYLVVTSSYGRDERRYLFRVLTLRSNSRLRSMGPRGDRGERACFPVPIAGPGSESCEWCRGRRAAAPAQAHAGAEWRVRRPIAGFDPTSQPPEARRVTMRKRGPAAAVPPPPRARARAGRPPRAVPGCGDLSAELSLCKLLRLLCAMCVCAIYYVYCSLVVAHGGAGRARVGWLGGRPRPRAGSRARLSSRAREFHRAHSPQFKANRSFEANRRGQCDFAERGGLWSPDIRWASGQVRLSFDSPISALACPLPSGWQQPCQCLGRELGRPSLSML